MLQIYKQNKALFEALVFAHVQRRVEGGTEEQTDNKNPEAQKVLQNAEKQRNKLGTTIFTEGLEGEPVRRAQIMLRALGYNRIEIDGDFTPLMTQTVKAFQTNESLKTDGTIGPETAIKLIKRFQEEYNSSSVRTKQEKLLDIDGRIGPKTEKAMEKYFSKQEGNENTGEMKLRGTMAEEALESLDSIFNRTLHLRKPYMRGNDVKTLQEKLGVTADGVFGKGTLKAIRAFQEENGLSVDGIAGAGTLNKLFGTADIKIAKMQKSSTDWKSSTEWKASVKEDGTNTVLGNEVIDDLYNIQSYLEAYNKTYGERGRILSNHKGLFGIMNQWINPNSEALAQELGVDRNKVMEVAGDSGLNEAGLMRFAGIAALSLIMSGGTSVAIELFGINVGTGLKQGPETQKILKLLSRKPGIPAKMKKLLTSKKTTVGDIEGVFDVLNNEPMVPANVKRNVQEIFNRNELSFLFDFFGGGQDYARIEELLAHFEGAENVDLGEQILREIYQIALVKLRSSRKTIIENKKDLEYRKEAGTLDPFGQGTDFVESDIEEMLKEVSHLEHQLGALGIEVSRIVNLSAKKDNILGLRSDYTKETARIDRELGRRRLRTISAKNLDTKGSYAPSIPKNLSMNALRKHFNTMRGAKIEGDKYSILANLMRGVKQHYGIDFNAREFQQAFLSMKRLDNGDRKAFNDKIVSNTSRKGKQEFQGKISSKHDVAVMNINGTKVFLKDNCTNVLTVVNGLATTVEYRRSIPVTIFLGGGGGGNDSFSPDSGSNPFDSATIDKPIFNSPQPTGI